MKFRNSCPLYLMDPLSQLCMGGARGSRMGSKGTGTQRDSQDLLACLKVLKKVLKNTLAAACIAQCEVSQEQAREPASDPEDIA